MLFVNEIKFVNIILNISVFYSFVYIFPALYGLIRRGASTTMLSAWDALNSWIGFSVKVVFISGWQGGDIPPPPNAHIFEQWYVPWEKTLNNNIRQSDFDQYWSANIDWYRSNRPISADPAFPDIGKFSVHRY